MRLLPGLIASYFVMFGCFLLEACSLLKGNGGGSVFRGEKRWGKLRGEETVVSLYIVTEESVFNSKKVLSNKWISTRIKKETKEERKEERSPHK